MRIEDKPLAGLVVLDLTLARAGPTCVRHLADWGADVIAVQPPSAGEDLIGARDGFDYQNLHRNKRAISLNLKSAAGHAAFLRLARKADVVVENMRPDVKRRLKVAYEDLKPVNPRLVYGSISGFGQDGPYGDRAGVDQIAQGMGGLMSVTGEPGRGPMRVGVAISDVAAGTLLALGIMMALYQRERTGEGRYVHTSLLESQLFMLDFQASRWLMAGEVAGQTGNDHPTLAPSSAYPTADGHINIAASTPKHWRLLCEAMGHPEWLENAEWRSSGRRARARDQVNAAIAEDTAKKPSAHWVELLEGVGVPCGPINSIDQAFADPQVKHLGMAAPVDHPRLGPTHMVASPLNLVGVDKAIRSAALAQPENTDEVLAWVGYSEAEIAAMRAEGSI
ncbi:MAG TPA: CoA transferase [Caulobacteraceae bacterium]|jgi:formyl-CoA transferase|nr:CoA transferase [Caulobacteraceae bacterium]